MAGPALTEPVANKQHLLGGNLMSADPLPAVAFEKAIDRQFERFHKLRVAIVHEWLYTIGGSERLLSAMLHCFPNATLYALFDTLNDNDRAKIGYTSTRTSFLQRIPGIGKHHWLYLPLMPIAVEQHDLSDYDLVISNTHAVAKGVLTSPHQLHLAYVHSTMRYAWDLQHLYIRQSGLDKGLRSFLLRMLLQYMRNWDNR